MALSRLLSRTSRQNIETKTLQFLRDKTDALIGPALDSPRAVGDITQKLIADNFENFVPPGTASNFSGKFARRAMADFAFQDAEQFYYAVDVKTHRLDTSFNMPNLTSVQRLVDFYRSSKNYFVLLKIDYISTGAAITFADVKFVPIEFIMWQCLTLGALGWGQIQIANANRIILDDTYTRKRWMLDLCDRVERFYAEEIRKIGKRQDHFKAVRAFWDANQID